MRLLITGVSGFIGSHIARRAAAEGNDVRGLVRPQSNLSSLHDIPLETVRGDLLDLESCRNAVHGTDAVVHCAASTSETSPSYEISYCTNVVGTAHLLQACSDASVRRFVFMSSQSANEGNNGAYGRTKLAAQKLVSAAPLEATVLRPSTVYGPGGRGLFAKIAGYVAKLPVIPLIGDGQQRFRPIHVDDVAKAALECLRSRASIGNTYDLGGGDGVSFVEFIDGVAAVFGRRRRKLHLPVTLCMTLATILGRVFERPPLTVDNVLGVTQMRECDTSAAERDFGFRPMSFQQGIDRLRHSRTSL